MDDACTKLELDFSHPAIDAEENFAASNAISLFREARETFVDNPGAREMAEQQLQRATEEVEVLLRLYGHLLRINRLLSENHPPSKARRDTKEKAHWNYGYGLAHDETIDPGSTAVRPVRLAHGLNGWECLLTAKSERGLGKFLHHNDSLYFMDRSTRQQETWPPNEYSPDRVVTIVGFRLSCDNAQGESVEFTIGEGGGILTSSLLVYVKAPHGRKWHCRIYFVGYELGELASRLGMVDS